MKKRSWFPFLLGVLFSSCFIFTLFLASRILVRPTPPPEQAGNTSVQEPATSVEINEIDINKPTHTDGNNIYFTSNLDGDYELYSIDIETKNATALTDTNAKYMEAVLSPSGNQLVFTTSNITAQGYE